MTDEEGWSIIKSIVWEGDYFGASRRVYRAYRQQEIDAMTALKKAGLGLAAAVLTFAVFVVQSISFLTPAVFVLSIWAANKFIRLQNIEYEYIVTNGELDVDKIMGRSKRKRLVTADARNFEVFAPMEPEYEKHTPPSLLRRPMMLPHQKTHRTGILQFSTTRPACAPCLYWNMTRASSTP